MQEVAGTGGVGQQMHKSEICGSWGAGGDIVNYLQRMRMLVAAESPLQQARLWLGHMLGISGFWMSWPGIWEVALVLIAS